MGTPWYEFEEIEDAYAGSARRHRAIVPRTGQAVAFLSNEEWSDCVLSFKSEFQSSGEEGGYEQ